MQNRGLLLLLFVGAGSIGYLFLGSQPDLFGQQAPRSLELIRPKEYPLKLDKELGVPAARLEEGRLHQVAVTLVEIPPGGKLEPHRHLAEEFVYIVSGKGYTTMWNGSEAEKKRYGWTEGDLLSPTLNAWHQHVNVSPDTPARYLSVTTAPLSEKLFKNHVFLYSNDFRFEEFWEWSLIQKPQYVGSKGTEMLAGHLLPDLSNRELREGNPGLRGISIGHPRGMAGNRLLGMEVRELSTANAITTSHRKLWDSVYYILKGDGSIVVEREGESERRLDWTEGDLFFVEAYDYGQFHARGGPGGRWLQMNTSGYFRELGLDKYGIQNKVK